MSNANKTRNVISRVLLKYKHRNNLSDSELSKIIGVSRTTLLKYYDEKSRIKLDKVLVLVEKGITTLNELDELIINQSEG